jgi:serine/threonine-protein kinase
MEFTQPPAGSSENQESAHVTERLKAKAWLSVRLWSYGGPAGELADFAWMQEAELFELVRGLITDCHGELGQQTPTTLAAYFQEPLQALSAARSLQQRLLTYQRPQPAQQVVSAILVRGQNTQEGTSATDILVEANSARVLVTEEIYDRARGIPGFQFNAKAAREPGQSGISEGIYELLWTDESTYGHLRKTGRTIGAHTSGAGRYLIQSELGHGAMGVVYKAYDQVIGRTVALKTISVNRNTSERDELVERLKQEAKAAGGLDHPNIITIFDVGQDDGVVYLCMQFVEGKTLMAVLADGEIHSIGTMLIYADQICDAVGFAHSKGVIHRDLKPANLMLTSQGSIKVLDFGIAKLEDASLTQPGLIVGTPTYMAPEQATGKKVDQRSDVFALGSVFYELFTREKPFKGDVTSVLYKIIHEDPVPPSVINPALPSGVDLIIRKALAKDPKDRFQNCEAMQAAFREQAALLKSDANLMSVAAVAVAGTAAAVKMQPKPEPGAHYLMETTTIRRPGRRVALSAMMVLLLAASLVAGWAYYIKSQTGSFPPQVVALLSRMRQWKDSALATAHTTAGNDEQAKPSQSAPVNEPVEPQKTAAPENSTAAPAAQIQPSVQESSPAPLPSAASGDAAPANSLTPSEAKPDTTGDDAPAKLAPAKPARVTPVKPAAKAAEDNASVDGFTRNEIPDLLAKANLDAGRGDYRLARYEYNIVLRLDQKNAAAREGMRRVTAAEQDRAQH